MRVTLPGAHGEWNPEIRDRDLSDRFPPTPPPSPISRFPKDTYLPPPKGRKRHANLVHWQLIKIKYKKRRNSIKEEVWGLWQLFYLFRGLCLWREILFWLLRTWPKTRSWYFWNNSLSPYHSTRKISLYIRKISLYITICECCPLYPDAV